MADLTASSTEPTVLFNDTSGIGVDWRLRVDPNDEMHLQRYQSAGALWQDRFVVTNTEATLSGGAPTLVFSDTTTSAADFRFTADGNLLRAQVDDGTGYKSGLEVDSTGNCYHAKGITAGHDYASGAGADQLFRLKRYSGTASGSGTITQGLGSEMKNKVLGVMFMMSKSTADPYSYDVFDFRSAAANGFYVSVTRSATEDTATVVYDNSGSGYPGGSTWYMICFFQPA